MIYAYRDLICVERDRDPQPQLARSIPGSFPPPPSRYFLLLRGPYCFQTIDGLPPSTTVTIPSSKPYDSATIPLRALRNPSRPREQDSATLLNEKKGNRHSSDSAGSDFSLWSDTGDLAEQLANEEDPLHIRLQNSVDDQTFSRPRATPSRHRPRHVHYAQQTRLEDKTTNPGLSKEAIEIPNPPARQIGRIEKTLAVVMTGDRQRSQIHGLTGKPLLYVACIVL